MRKRIPTIHVPLIVFLLIATSCIRDVRIDLGPLPDRIVLNASACPDEDVRAHLSKTWFIMDSIPEFDLPTATVSVYLNDTYQGKMKPDDTPGDSLHMKGQYVLPGCRVKAGDRLRIEASASGFDPVRAETLIPAKAEIVRVDTSSFQSSPFYSIGMRLHVYLQEANVVSPAYYRLIVERITDYQKGDSILTITSYNGLGGSGYYGYGSYGYSYDGFQGQFLSYEDPVFQSFGGSPIVNQMDGRYCMGVFTSEALGGNTSIRVSFSPVDYSYTGEPISTTVHYEVRLLSISEAYYRYLYVMRGFSITIGDADFGALVEPADTYSNVEGGFGIVAGYQLSPYRITMPTDTVPPLWNPWDGYTNAGMGLR